MQRIKNRYDAESAFCNLFVEVGRAIGIAPYGEDTASYSSELLLSPSTIGVIHECEFEDPHFIGGPGAFNFAKSRTDVNRIFESAESVVVELFTALEKVNPSRAQTFRRQLEEIKNWMLRNCS